ncbi:MAG: hypothetical protein JNM07_12660 [Phycisphaerae bacterium]|nr:hypothetical protein [Phycisphaerae bacterium]
MSARKSAVKQRPNATSGPMTLVHVTHEAIEHLGGIGTVLEGLVTSRAYRGAVERTILVGPLPHPGAKRQPLERLGPFALECRYSGVDGHDPDGHGALLAPIAWAFGTPMVYGTRRFEEHAGGASGGGRGDAEVLLIDVSHPDKARLAEQKFLLSERYGLDSHRYERDWDYEEYCRLAGPAYHALAALLGPTGRGGPRAVIVAHEFMGLCTALRCGLDRGRFRTVFHAHECSTARRLVEHMQGHDTGFYPAMRRATAKSRFVADVFGPQDAHARHALVSRAHHLDATLAVGDETARELRFLSEDMSRANVRVAYNGVPAARVTLAERKRSRARLDAWLRNVLGFAPDYLFTHVTRPVVSKGIWRDLKVCAHLERALAERGQRAVYVLLTCGAPPRSFQDATRMAHEHGWPARHRDGYPDLDGPETGLYRSIEHYNDPARPGAGAIIAVLVNQFGFSRARLGEAAPEGLTLADLRRGADAEFGLSIYEPFGIAMLEPLHAGAVCVVSSVCGCVGLARRALKELGIRERDAHNLLIADFTRPATEHPDPAHLKRGERDAIEETVAAFVATELLKRLPRGDRDRSRLLSVGQRLASRMSWEVVCRDEFLPVLRRALIS